MNRLAALLVCVALVPACDGGKDKTPPAKADAKANAEPGQKADAKMAANPHGGPDDAKAANPHAMPPAGPHGGMGGPPMMGGMGQLHKGPPREVTPSGETTPSQLRGLAVAAPKEWESQTPKSQMRVAEWFIPGPGGDGELVVYRFPGGGGGVDANIDRWKGQFDPPEGKTIDDVSTVKEVEGKDGLRTTLVDVQGTFRAAVVPGAEEKHNEADYRMLALIVQGYGDPFYFKLVGPTATVDLWAPHVETMIGSFAKAPEGETAAGGDAKAPAADDAKADAKAADAKAADAKAADAKGEAKAADAKAGE